MSNIEILMKDGCTKVEAEKHLARGTMVFDGADLEENFSAYMKEWGIDDDNQAGYKAMVDKNKPMQDWGIVEHEDKTYYIMYVL